MARKSLSILLVLFVLLVSACASPTDTGVNDANTNTGLDNTNTGVDNTNSGLDNSNTGIDNTNSELDNTNTGNTNTDLGNTNTGVDNTNSGNTNTDLDNTNTGAANDNTNTAGGTPAVPAGTGINGDDQSVVVDQVTEWLAAQLNVNVEDIEIVSVTPQTFNDSCLGLGGPNESCLQALTEGFVITAQVNGQTYTVNASLDGSAIRMAQEAVTTP